MSYAEKLKDPRWQQMRLKILHRDGFRCRSCGDEKSELHVHHASYQKKKNPWEVDVDYIFTLCKPCHERVGLIQQAVALNLPDNPHFAALVNNLVVLAANGEDYFMIGLNQVVRRYNQVLFSEPDSEKSRKA
jgi:hypothetical protein